MYQTLITPEAVRKKVPLSTQSSQLVSSFRNTVKCALNSPEVAPLIIAAGPCSIHCPEIALSYAQKLQSFASTLGPYIQIFMRVFFEKPRTKHAWKGFIHDPHRDNTYIVEDGIIKTRQLLSQITEMGLPIVSELLDPHISLFVEDFLSHGIIGSRTCTSQVHRQLASHMPFPVGFKNGLDGTVESAIQGALYATHAQSYVGTDMQGRLALIDSPGNPDTHVVLRGGYNGSNIDLDSIENTLRLKTELGLRSPLMIDCAHGNAKYYKDQIHNFRAFLDLIKRGHKKHLLGAMLESHLEEGNAMSVTDPCLSLSDTLMLLEEANAAFTALSQ